MKQTKEILALDSLDIDCERRVCAVAIHRIEHNLPLETEDALHTLKCVQWSLFTEKDWFYLDSIKSKSFITKHISSLPDRNHNRREHRDFDEPYKTENW